MQYLFIFGNTPELSLLELQSVLEVNFKTFKFMETTNFGAVVEFHGEFTKEIFLRLGGSVKYGKVVAQNVQATDLGRVVVDSFSTGTGDFGLSYYGRGQVDLPKLAGELKDSGSVRRRYVLPRQESFLSAVVVSKQKLDEIVIFQTENGYVLARTEGVFDFESWNKRDYGRPNVEPHLGMLPPRVARMMVNIANSKFEIRNSKFTLLDPFCGVGTILMEGLVLGHSVVGIDSDPNQIERAKKNLEWAAKEYSVSGIAYPVFVGDAIKTSHIVRDDKVDAIVTEPDLGPASGIIKDQVSIINERLEKLYADCLKNWKSVLKPGGRVVMIIPSFVIRGNQSQISVNSILLQHIIDKAKVMGYSSAQHPIQYFRQQAVVRRNIVIFNLKF